jgi:hypothetical protein
MPHVFISTAISLQYASRLQFYNSFVAVCLTSSILQQLRCSMPHVFISATISLQYASCLHFYSNFVAVCLTSSFLQQFLCSMPHVFISATISLQYASCLHFYNSLSNNLLTLALLLNSSSNNFKICIDAILQLILRFKKQQTVFSTYIGLAKRLKPPILIKMSAPPSFLGAFARFRKTTIWLFMSVCPSAWSNSAPTRRIFS